MSVKFYSYFNEKNILTQKPPPEEVGRETLKNMPMSNSDASDSAPSEIEKVFV